MTPTDENRLLIEGFWVDLYRQDFSALGARFAEDGEYTTSSRPRTTSPAVPQRSPPACASPSTNSRSLQRAAPPGGWGAFVMTEHVEHWEWPTGETMALDVASVHEIHQGKIVRWCDYWDMNVLTAAAPQWWFEHVLQGWR